MVVLKLVTLQCLAILGRGVLLDDQHQPRARRRHRHKQRDDQRDFFSDDDVDDGKRVLAFQEHKALYNAQQWTSFTSRQKDPLREKGVKEGAVGKNLCEDERMVPEVFVLGARQAGTTTFAADLDRSPGIQFATGWGPLLLGNNFTHKEGHFFDFYHVAGDYLLPKSFPGCNHRARRVGVDASARYLMDPKVPERIHMRYSHFPLEPGKLKFVVLLRDPLERLHSDYYHSTQEQLCHEQDHISFGTFLKSILEGRYTRFIGGGDKCSDRLEGSLYRDQLARWFKWFHRPQFTIMPWLYAVAPGTDGRPRKSAAQALWYKLGVQNTRPSNDTHLGIHPHPDLADEGLKRHVLEEAREWFDKQTGPKVLAELFVSGGRTKTNGVNLYGYTKGPEDQDEIAKWIKNNWGQAKRPKSANVKTGSTVNGKLLLTDKQEHTMPADDRKGIVDYNLLLTKPAVYYNVKEWNHHKFRWIPKETPPLEKERVRENWCSGGWQTPSLFVFGGPFSATTSFASDLEESPNIQFATGWGQEKFTDGRSIKEPHIHDSYYYAGQWFAKMMFQPCSEHRHYVAVDATTRYMLDPDVPHRVKEVYGRTYKNLRFTVLLREPLHRFHADFYHSKKYNYCHRQANMTFSEMADEVLGGHADFYMGGIGDCSDRLEGSLYRDALERWFKVFHPSQFTIVPWLYQIAPGQDGRPGQTLAEAHFEQQGVLSPKEPARNTHLGAVEHPALKDEQIEPDKLNDLKFFFDKMAGADAMATFLANTGANLYGYIGSDGDTAAIANWLSKNWKEAPALSAAVSPSPPDSSNQRLTY